MTNESSHNLLKNEIIWVNPFLIKFFSPPPNWWWYARLDRRIKNKNIKLLLKKFAMGKIYYRGNWDRNSILFENSDWIRNIKSFKSNYINYKNSEWFKNIKFEIYKKGFYKHKNFFLKNEKDIISFFEDYLKKLIISLQQKGYLLNEDSNDIPKVLIGRSGNLIKTGNGCHRLAIIKEFDIICKYPVQIHGIHDKFEINDTKARELSVKELIKFIYQNFNIETKVEEFDNAI